jgi:hypothetical protein
MSTGGRNTKFFVLAAGILVAAGAVSYFGGFYPPATDQSTGAIGAANRYRAPQMTDKDVVLADTEVAAFMQTETFDRIMKNDAARKLLASPEFRAAMQGQGVNELLSQPGVGRVFQDAGLLSILESLGQVSRQDRVQSRVDAELFASVMETAGSKVLKPSDASGHARRDEILSAAHQRIQEASAGGQLSLLNDADFLNALTAIQGEAAGGARYDESQGKALFYKNPQDNPNLQGVAQAIGEASGRKAQGSILEEALGRTGKFQESWGKALKGSPELNAVVLAALEANAFGSVMNEASGQGRQQKILEAAGRAIDKNLGNQKFDRLLTDASALEKIHQAHDVGSGPVMVELASHARTDAQWNAVFDEAQGQKLFKNADVLAGVKSLMDEAGKNPRFVEQVQALSKLGEAGSSVVLDALQSSPQAAGLLMSGPVQKALAGTVD